MKVVLETKLGNQECGVTVVFFRYFNFSASQRNEEGYAEGL